MPLLILREKSRRGLTGFVILRTGRSPSFVTSPTDPEGLESRETWEERRRDMAQEDFGVSDDMDSWAHNLHPA